MTLFKALKYRFFALLWSGQTISRLGDSLYRIALSWWVLQKTGSAAIMGTVLIFSTLPMLVFLLIGGVVVDRFNRVRLMLASDIVRGILIAGVSWLAATGHLEVWHIFLVSTFFGIVGAFFQPAYTSIVPDLTPAEALPSANSLTSLSGQVAGIVGPALGAGLIAWGGNQVAFALDALSFFISAACLVPLVEGFHTCHQSIAKLQHDPGYSPGHRYGVCISMVMDHDCDCCAWECLPGWTFRYCAPIPGERQIPRGR